MIEFGFGLDHPGLLEGFAPVAPGCLRKQSLEIFPAVGGDRVHLESDHAVGNTEALNGFGERLHRVLGELVVGIERFDRASDLRFLEFVRGEQHGCLAVRVDRDGELAVPDSERLRGHDVAGPVGDVLFGIRD